MSEAPLLGFLLSASVGYFCWKSHQRLGRLRTASGVLRVDGVGLRLERLLIEVLLQSRVLKGRPIAGLLHALVMWGFLAFAWVSLEHVAQGFGGLADASPSDSWYGAFAAAWAVLVLVGIVGLTVRRFALRPVSLGPPSAGSAVVAALIVLLMWTYLWGRVLDPGSAMWRTNWWVHTLSMLGMLWVIPNSKHLHLLLGPANVFFRAGDVTSPTRALREEDDEDIGLARFADLTKKDILDVNACVECGRCTDVCPANESGGSLNPKEIILQIQRGLLRDDNLDRRVAGAASEIASGEAWVGEDELFQCLTCGACEEACPVGIEHVGAKIVDLRRGLVSEGRTDNEKLSQLFRTIERAPHNAWAAPQDTRSKLIEAAGFPIYDGSQRWLLWLGCGCSYDPHGNDVARAMARLLNAAGESWGVLVRETCCGDLARRAGNEYLYFELSEKVAEAILDSGAKRIVTCDPHCCRTFDVDYRQSEEWQKADIEVLHHTEALSRLTPKLSLTSAGTSAVAYHDPCYLARGRGVTVEPRRVLGSAGLSVSEMERSGAQTACCGAGGGQLFIADDRKEDGSASRVNHLRFEQALATGAGTVAVACPYCAIMLEDAAGHAGRGDVQIVDVAELLAARLPS